MLENTSFPDELVSDKPSIWCTNPKFRERFMKEYRVKKFSVSGLVKLVVSRSCRSAVNVLLPSHCTSEDLEFVSNECPALKVLSMPSNLVHDHGELISRLVSKWKDLQQLHLGSTLFLKEILIQIALHCKSFNGLSVRFLFDNIEASALATILPNIKYLWLRRTSLQRGSLQMILKGCKELMLLDVRDCDGFEAEDEEILKMASHIKTFLVEGSRIYDDEEEYYYDDFY